MNFDHKPKIFYSHELNSEFFSSLYNDSKVIKINTIDSQLLELAIINNPKKQQEIRSSCNVEAYLPNIDYDNYGNWIYYPWLNTMVKILEKKDFIKVRTSRNQYKITPQEQEALEKKSVGIVGLSVGQSVAKTIALERIAGKLILADFDELELSNLNRIQAGIHNLGLPKTVITARQISEIDPYIDIVCYHDGITIQNIHTFFKQQMDLLIDECDSLSIKVELRKWARKNKLPLLMDTSDNGMLDIERYDLIENYPFFHGKVSENTLNSCLKKDLSKQEVINIVLEIIDKETMSEELKYSISQIGKTINTWPQLGSDVCLGGAITAITAREILLKKSSVSGRFFFDYQKIVSNG